MDIRHAVGVQAGVPDATLRALPAWRESDRFTAREHAALEFCERLVRDGDEVGDDCLARLREHFSDGEMVELSFIVGYQVFASTFAKAFRLTPQGFAA
jgi:alkylhydroperoxidase family enzyme